MYIPKHNKLKQRIPLVTCDLFPLHSMTERKMLIHRPTMPIYPNPLRPILRSAALYC